MLRAIGLGVAAVAAVLAILATVLAIGITRIRMADSEPAVDSSQATTPSPTTQTTQPFAEEAKEDSTGQLPPPLDVQTIELKAEDAKLSAGLSVVPEKVPTKKPKPKPRVGPPDPPPVPRGSIGGWHSAQDVAEWTMTLNKASVYEIDAVCAWQPINREGFICRVTLGEQELSFEVPPAKSRAQSFNVKTFGNVSLPAGALKVRFRVEMSTKNTMLRLQSVRLIPAG